MVYTIVNGELYHADELMHYGVLGMKWGVRRGRVEKAYEKASKKLDKLDRRAQAATKKARRKRIAADSLESRKFVTKRKRLKREANAKRALRLSTAHIVRAKDWVAAMDRTFANTDVSLSKEQIEIGRKYVELLDKRTFG